MQPSAHLNTNHPEYPLIDQLNLDALRSRFSSLDRVKVLAEMALERSKKAGYIKGLLEGQINLAFALFRNSEYVEASRLAQEAVSMAQEHWMAAQEGDARIVLGNIRRKMGDHTGAFQELSTALTLGEQAHDDHVILASLNGIAIVYDLLGDYQSSIDYFWRSLDFNTDPITADQNRAVCLNNCCFPYSAMGNFSKALECAQESHQIFQRIGDKFNESFALMNIGNAYRLGGNFDLALDHYRQALDIAQVYNETYNLTLIIIGLTETYLEMNQPEEALIQSERAIHHARANGSALLMADAYKVAAKAHKLRGDYKMAYEQIESYRAAQDEIFNQQATSRIKAMQAIHDVDSARKEAELHRLRSTTLELQIKDMEQTALIRREQERLTLALAQEHEFSQLKSQLMNRISRELRTPLTVIQSAGGLLKEYQGRMSPEKIQHHISVINAEIDRTIAIVDDIVRIAQEGNTLPDIARRNADLKALCVQALEEVTPQPQTRTRVNIKVAPNAVQEKVNPLLLTRSLACVLSNALKYSAATSPVQVKVSRVHSELIIRVSDSGIGIPPEEVDKVFKPMFRGSNIGDISGAGLGLTIAHNCVTAHNGTIQVESALTSGTTVTIRLPVPA